MEEPKAESSKSVKKTTVNENVCGLCNKEKAKYCCPRCNILYCSQDCYTSKNHLTCSEEFYKECVKENLDVSDVEAKDKMMEILKRSHEENKPIDLKEEEELDSDDDDETAELGKRLAGVDLDDAESVWANLTEAERQEFEAFIKSGDVSKYVPKWEPWWKFYSHKKIIDLNEISTFKANCPKLIDKIKDIFTLSPKYPPEIVKYNIINLLTSYVFTARFFNGEYMDFAREACSCITNLALSLKINHNFEDFSTSVESVHCQIISNATWIQADEENIQNMREDIHSILKGPHKSEMKYYIFSALSDIYRLIETAIKDSSEKHGKSFAMKFPDSTFPTVILETKSKLKIHLKKIDFYLSYVKDCWQHTL